MLPHLRKKEIPSYPLDSAAGGQKSPAPKLAADLHAMLV
jgi:hypothetical protein